MEELGAEQERAMVERFLVDEPLKELEPVCSREELAGMQEQCIKNYVHSDLLDYIVRVIHATRKHSKVENGVSPRGTLAFVRAAQGYAMVRGREYVVPEDIKAVAVPVLAHRLSLSAGADLRRSAEQVIEDIISSISLPTEDWSGR